MNPRCLGNIYNQEWGTGLPGNVWDPEYIAATITTCQGGGRQPMILENRVEKIGQVSSEGSEGGSVYDCNSISPTLTAGTHGYAMGNILINYRIRKLTPKECFRLMGVTDEDADKMIAVNSNTQCYKQAGNSIVVAVMAAMFKKLF